METGLPKLPGLEFENKLLKQNHTVPHCLDFLNGYRVSRKPRCGIGGEPLKANSIEFSAQDDSTMYDPILTYGRVKPQQILPFRPHFVVYDKVVLTFRAFFTQGVPESANEHYRIRIVNIMYFMEDHSITVMEPTVLNCGFPQGRVARRGKIPKNVAGEIYTWKDFNIGIDIEINGIVYHIIDCDEFTKDFLAAQGVELNEPECYPVDPVATQKTVDIAAKIHKTPSDDDKLRRYLEFQGMVLTFNCVLDETDRPFGECMTYKMYYFLEDDTVSVKELKENQEGRDHFPMLLKRTKLPRNWKQQPVTHPAVALEITNKEVNEYYQPKHFRIGETIFVYGRRFLLLDCDKFTRKYFSEVLGEPQKERIELNVPTKSVPVREIPEYLGFGTPEDSLASTKFLIPKAPKKDVVRYLVNANKFLRFQCSLDSSKPEYQMRKFVIMYSLADGKIQINEPPKRNSGITGGKFLSARMVVRPGSNPDLPEYYCAKDFYIGAILTINDYRFIIEKADLYVYRYMLEHPEEFSPDAIESVRNQLLLDKNLTEELRVAFEQDCKINSRDECEEINQSKRPVCELESFLHRVQAENEATHPSECVQPTDIRNMDCRGITDSLHTFDHLVKKTNEDEKCPCTKSDIKMAADELGSKFRKRVCFEDESC